jgi:hypothetical protein
MPSFARSRGEVLRHFGHVTVAPSSHDDVATYRVSTMFAVPAMLLFISPSKSGR